MHATINSGTIVLRVHLLFSEACSPLEELYTIIRVIVQHPKLDVVKRKMKVHPDEQRQGIYI